MIKNIKIDVVIFLIYFYRILHVFYVKFILKMIVIVLNYIHYQSLSIYLITLHYIDFNYLRIKNNNLIVNHSMC